MAPRVLKKKIEKIGAVNKSRSMARQNALVCRPHSYIIKLEPKSYTIQDVGNTFTFWVALLLLNIPPGRWSFELNVLSTAEGQRGKRASVKTSPD